VPVITSDASAASAQKRVADRILQTFGRVDVLFIDPGFADLGPFDKFDEAGFDRSLAIILKGPYFLMQALLPVCANPARESQPSFHWLARLSGELVLRGIRVNAVSSGPIATPLYSTPGLSEEQLKSTAAASSNRFRRPMRGYLRACDTIGSLRRPKGIPADEVCRSVAAFAPDFNDEPSRTDSHSQNQS
jgi:NAD(P)-dependent dehydrogenase (short-subunit alcohol dehydrogenase family)